MKNNDKGLSNGPLVKALQKRITTKNRAHILGLINAYNFAVRGMEKVSPADRPAAEKLLTSIEESMRKELK